MKKIIAIIPARYGSSRFPGKPLAKILDKPMIQWVYENTKKIDSIHEVYVATDDQRIYQTVEGFGGKAIMTSKNHECGVDRLVEAADILDLNMDDVVLNIQGDEPLIRSEMIDELITIFEDETVNMATLKIKIHSIEELENTNVVKVITDKNDNAIYFSRYCIPFERDTIDVNHYRHIGVYGYKRNFLSKYGKLERGTLEVAESLEQLRVIENGLKIRVKETLYETVGVDTPEQIKEVENRLLKEKH